MAMLHDGVDLPPGGKQMVKITFNEDKCRKCGLCATACPLALPAQKEKGSVPTIDTARLQSCFRCGHCVAICPQGSVGSGLDS